MKTPIRTSARLALSTAALYSSTAWTGAVLWYNGDFNSINALTNELSTEVSASRVYDNFVVPVGGWTIDRVWSNNLMGFTTSLASWEIRSGVSGGSGGTLVSSGSQLAATQTASGRSAFGLLEYTVEVGGLSLFLAPGEYWLSVTPVGQGIGRSYVSRTSGSGAAGTPAGDDERAFIDNAQFSLAFASTSSPAVNQQGDFSMGVGGTPGRAVNVPEPASFALVALAVAGAVAARRVRS